MGEERRSRSTSPVRLSVCLSFYFATNYYFLYFYPTISPMFRTNRRRRRRFSTLSNHKSLLLRAATLQETAGKILWVREAGLVELRRAGPAKYRKQTKIKNLLHQSIGCKTSSHEHADIKRAEGMHESAVSRAADPIRRAARPEKKVSDVRQEDNFAFLRSSSSQFCTSTQLEASSEDAVKGPKTSFNKGKLQKWQFPL